MIINGQVIASEADIDKSKVIISVHAIERFFQRSKGHYPKVPMPKDYEQAKEMLTKLFLYSYYKNAIDSVRRIGSLIDHGETFFFRYENWLFPVNGGRNNEQLSLATVLWNVRW